MKQANRSNVPSCCAALALLLLTSCGARGALGQSALKDPSGADTGIEGPIAVGAQIAPRWSLDIQGSGAPAVTLASARPDVLAVDGHHLIGRAPGVSAVMIAAPDGRILDFMHLWVVQPTRVALEALTDDRRIRGEIRDAVELVVGESIAVAPAVYAGNQRLTGSVPTEWTLSEPIAGVLRDGAPDRRRLVARAPGRATLTVRSAQLTATLELAVVP
jgi:hypothetical protein